MLKKLLLVCVLCLHALDGHCSPPATSVPLSEAERSYLAQLGPITMCVDPDWTPFERINEAGEHEGIAADLIQQVALRLGITIRLHRVRLWSESLEASQQDRCQIMSFLNQTPVRDRWLLFTRPIFSDPNIIITREEQPFIADLHTLRGKTVALPGGTMVEERIRKDYPDLSVIVTQSEREAVTMVSERKADLTVRTLIGAAYAIRKEGLFNLKISGQIPEYTNQLRIGVHRNHPELREILDRGVATLSDQEKEIIWNRHVSINVQQSLDYRLLAKIVLAAALVLGIFTYWNRKLSRLNRELERLSITDRLTGLNNRMRLDECFDREIQRCQRYPRTFSIILLDIDHFKQINDSHGHQVGDQVLIAVANCLQGNLRQTDVIGRWGGEEFMVLCPETDLEGAMTLAENLRGHLAATAMPPAGQVTASFGIATYAPNDQPQDMVSRADRALYAAKHAGRNRVHSEPTPSKPELT
ncbi:diguanylate cyclase [Dechloromonas sp. ZY10]|uniref:diguanylate cyclase n=1 Tax=Dechloromonas aquae TaxID=2664436 RepID=UPI0035284415